MPEITTKTRHYQQTYQRECGHCRTAFTAWNRSARYCGDTCRTRAQKERTKLNPSSDWLRTPVKCGICATEFFRTPESSPIRKYCSDECSVRARRRDHLKFKELYPDAMKKYNRHRYKTYGRDTLITRLYKHYPDLPKVCEAKGCDESRILEAAHKPEFKRNGAWRTLDKYERHMFWMLCPTCHRVLDFGIETMEQLGLK